MKPLKTEVLNKHITYDLVRAFKKDCIEIALLAMSLESNLLLISIIFSLVPQKKKDQIVFEAY